MIYEAEKIAFVEKVYVDGKDIRLMTDNEKIAHFTALLEKCDQETITLAFSEVIKQRCKIPLSFRDGYDNFGLRYITEI